jgi:thiol-disulfide isomerase/thioredoxin
MDTRLVLALAAGVGAAACWGDPDGMVSRALGLNRLARLLAGLFCAGLAALALFLPPAAERPADAAPALAWPLRRVPDGQATGLDAFAGKVLVLNLWATWCGPCVAEMPSLLALRDQAKDLPEVAFAFVSLDQNPEAVPAMIERRGWRELPAYFPAGPMPKEFQTPGIPATFIIDHRGRIAERHVGALDWSQPQWHALLKKLAAAARETPTGPPKANP